VRLASFRTRSHDDTRCPFDDVRIRDEVALLIDEETAAEGEWLAILVHGDHCSNGVQISLGNP
jgi:hypothetical protein